VRAAIEVLSSLAGRKWLVWRYAELGEFAEAAHSGSANLRARAASNACMQPARSRRARGQLRRGSAVYSDAAALTAALTGALARRAGRAAAHQGLAREPPRARVDALAADSAAKTAGIECSTGSHSNSPAASRPARLFVLTFRAILATASALGLSLLVGPP